MPITTIKSSITKQLKQKTIPKKNCFFISDLNLPHNFFFHNDYSNRHRTIHLRKGHSPYFLWRCEHWILAKTSTFGRTKLCSAFFGGILQQDHLPSYHQGHDDSRRRSYRHRLWYFFYFMFSFHVYQYSL